VRLTRSPGVPPLVIAPIEHQILQTSGCYLGVGALLVE
jgi:hypothetical protein